MIRILLLCLACVFTFAAGAQAIGDSTRPLPEAIVTGSKVHLIYKSAQYAVEDYSFWDSGLLIIASKGSINLKTALLLLDNSGDTIAKSVPPFYPQRLIRNCAGVPYAVTDDSVYRISRDGAALSFGKALPIFFENVIASCRLTDGHNFYYKYGDPKHCSVAFMRRSAEDTVLQPMYTLTDETAARIVDWNANRFRSWARSHKMDAFDAGIDWSSEAELYNISFEIATSRGFNKHNFRDVLAADLYRLSDTAVLITDYLNSQLRCFTDTGALIVSVPMEKRWQDFHNNTVLRDEATGRFYIHFSKNGRTQYIQELQPHNGVASGPLFVFERPFAERVSVHNGKVYFLQHDPAGGAVRQLFVQRW